MFNIYEEKKPAVCVLHWDDSQQAMNEDGVEEKKVTSLTCAMVDAGIGVHV